MSQDNPSQEKALAALRAAHDELVEADASQGLLKMFDEVIEQAEEEFGDVEQGELDFDEDWE